MKLILWCVHANLSSALGQKGCERVCRHRAFSIGFKIIHSELLGIDVKQMSWVFPQLTCHKILPWFWPCKPAVFLLETQSSLSPATSTLQCSCGYRPVAPTLTNILMNLVPFCEWFSRAEWLYLKAFTVCLVFYIAAVPVSDQAGWNLPPRGGSWEMLSPYRHFSDSTSL